MKWRGLLQDDAKQRLSAPKAMQKLDSQYIPNQIAVLADVAHHKVGKIQQGPSLDPDPNLKFIPRYVILVPGNYEANDGLLSFFFNMINRVAEWTGITGTLHLWICDEGPDLLGLEKPPHAPVHDPLQIQIPEATLRRMAPLPRVVSTLLVAAKLIDTCHWPRQCDPLRLVICQGTQKNSGRADTTWQKSSSRPMTPWLVLASTLTSRW